MKMITLKTMVMLTVYLISGPCLVMSVIRVTGYVGGSAQITCPYDGGYEGYSKYLCRGECSYGNKDKPVQTEDQETCATSGRLSLHDDIKARVFTVTITGLTAGDSGKYWCGVKTGFGKYDVYTEVALNVSPAPQMTDAPLIAPQMTDAPLIAPKMRDAPCKTTGVTDAPSTTAFLTYEVDDVLASQQAGISNFFYLVVCSVAAGAGLLLTLAVVLGCFAVKKKKGSETHDDTTSFINPPAESGTTRQRRAFEVDPLYECLELKQCGAPQAEHEGVGQQSCGKHPLLMVRGSSGRGAENEYESMNNTLTKTGKAAKNECASMANALSKAGNVVENEYESMSNTCRKVRKADENEYESMANTLSKDKRSMGNEYESMANTLSRDKNSMENEYESMASTLSKGKKNMENEYESMASTLSKGKNSMENEYESMASTLSRDKRSMESEYESMANTFSRGKRSMENDHI
ncbi:hypothetical protein ACEWY4_017331 [Coilia grayii]|uniref:Immunoglobulin domain-containing protein n=1 Tax=Coilia grayii TaxID=363190 RepID=A0ABD1JGI4_9TELE